MQDAKAAELSQHNVVELFKYLNGMWIVAVMQILEDLLNRGLFYPNPERYRGELMAAGVHVERTQVAMGVVLHKAGQTITDQKFLEVYGDRLRLLPEQQQREVREFWAAGPKPGLRAGTAPISSSLANLSWDRYVDQFETCRYDVNYKVTNYFSSILQLTYKDGTTIELDIESDLPIPGFQLSSAAARDAIAGGQIGRGGRIFPATMAPRTLPRIWAAREEAIAIQNEEFKTFAAIAVNGVAFALSVPTMPVGAAPAAGAAARPRVIRQRVNGVPRTAGAAISEAEMQAINAIRADPTFSKLSVREIQAIRTYTGEGWSDINLALRHGGGSAEAQATARNLISGMEKLPGYAGKLTRSESLAVSDATAKYIPGRTFAPDGMLSTSRGGAVAQREGNVAITVHAIGKAGRDITKASTHVGKEAEVLFPPGTRFSVESVEQVGQAVIVVLREL